MDRRYPGAMLLAMLVACIAITGCHSGSGTTVLAVTTTSLPNGMVGTAYTPELGATGGTPPYTWSQSSGGPMPAGVTVSNTGVFTGTPTTAGTFGPYVFTVTDSASDTANSPSLSITIASGALAVTTSNLPNGIVETPYSFTLGAVGGTSPYTWAETSGGAMPPGLEPVTIAGVIAGVPTTVGTYGPYVFTVTDAANATAKATNLTITIGAVAANTCPTFGNEAALTSANPYAFLAKGTDGAGNPIAIAGSFTPNGRGGIASATVDYNGFTNGPEQMQVNTNESSYAFASSGLGCLDLIFSGTVAAAASEKHAGTSPRFEQAKVVRAGSSKVSAEAATTVSAVQFSFSLGAFDGTVYHSGRIMESDYASGSGTIASGFLYVQTGSAFDLSSLQANYAFGLDGWTANTTGYLRTAIAGAFTNASGALSTGYADLDIGGTASGELMGGSGALNSSVDLTTGRGTGTYTIPTASGSVTFDFAFYVLNGADLILLSSDSPIGAGSAPLVSGRALASSASYAVGALNGYYLLASQGLDVSGSTPANLAEIGTVSATSAGAIPTANIYSNDAGTYATNQYPNSSYTVEAASGRTSFTGLTGTPPVVYLAAAGGTTDDGIVGFLVGTDTQTSSGVLVNQTSSAPKYALTSVSGNYAASTDEDVDGLNGAFAGLFTFNGKGGYSVVPQVVGPMVKVPGLGTTAINADGSGSLDGGNFPLVTSGAVIYAIPDSGDPQLFVFRAGTLPSQ